MIGEYSLEKLNPQINISSRKRRKKEASLSWRWSLSWDLDCEEPTIKRPRKSISGRGNSDPKALSAEALGPQVRGTEEKDNLVETNWTKGWEVGGETVEIGRSQIKQDLVEYGKTIGFVLVTVKVHGQGWIKQGRNMDQFAFLKDYSIFWLENGV